MASSLPTDPLYNILFHSTMVHHFFFSLWLMSYLRYLCLFAYGGVQHILSCVFVLFFLYPMLPVSLNCPLFFGILKRLFIAKLQNWRLLHGQKNPRYSLYRCNIPVRGDTSCSSDGACRPLKNPSGSRVGRSPPEAHGWTCFSTESRHTYWYKLCSSSRRLVPLFVWGILHTGASQEKWKEARPIL